MTSRRTLLTRGSVVAAVLLTAGAATLLPSVTPRASADGLVAYASCNELLAHHRAELARTATAWGVGGGYPGAVPATAEGDTAASGDAAASPTSPTGNNVQEAGVDEPDVAKVVGGVVYAVAQGRLQVVRAGAAPEPTASLPLGDQAYGGELLVQDDRLLVVLPGWGDGPADSSWPTGTDGTTTLVLVDVTDPSAPAVLERLEVTGRYLSARSSDGAVRLVTASAPWLPGVPPVEPYGPEQERVALRDNVAAAQGISLDAVLPQMVRTTAAGQVLSDGAAVDCQDVRHAGTPRGASTLLVTTLDLTRGLAPQDTTAVTTDGDLVYASTDRLYVATSRWGTSLPFDASEEVTTELHAFDTTSPTTTRYAGSGSVDGYVLGRWALSSYDGHLRVATTSSPPWGGPGQDQASASQVVVLAEQAAGLVEVGRVDGLGVGERIFAVRYFGDLATVVTFRQTDPLYVLDLADPAAPRLLGELKVPGFSTYLHPFGEDRLLGVGMDADDQGQVTGFQVSLFDLSDRTRPVQLDRLSLGQGHSPAGQDSRAFGFDAARGVALLPWSAWTPTSSTSGALGVRVTAAGTLEQAGLLEVVAPVDRVLHDGEHVYAVGQDGVVAATADSFRQTGSASFGR